MKVYEFGDIVHKLNGQPCRVLNDEGGEEILVAVILSGWGDPHCRIDRTQIKELQPKEEE